MEQIIYTELEDIRNEIIPIIDFLKFNTDDENETTKISLKNNITFKEFSLYFPNIKRKDLVLLFDICDNKQREVYFILQEHLKELV